MPHPILAHFELRLDHQHQIRTGRSHRSQCRQHHGQGDEGQIRHDQVGRVGQIAGRQVAHIRAFHHHHVIPRSHGPGQLPVSHINGDHPTHSALEQHLGEPSGRCTGIQRRTPLHVECERVERADQLVCTARDVLGLGSFAYLYRRGLIDLRCRLRRQGASHEDPAFGYRRLRCLTR